MFREWKSEESNAFPGFSCYLSDDLVNWMLERNSIKLYMILSCFRT
ncbi:hypothetical protein GPL16_05920 [Bacteroides ovatus]|uniref:Uncharacterized protein n=1 Tax=Bacteroides ovatus (strain ATCC 8483 / DSM 1896 / JCM 5824 / BCRC 10623 / CCUG 4943 / NCTC 11153) TaxID=411476 RepID=A0AAN3D9C9_BACO1|nr:hypothetical protein BACOVA_02778 [Bacteroides ovatus ATCC 8483]MBT9876552.1 hypothetical protein [Bacteroides ovatus]